MAVIIPGKKTISLGNSKAITLPKKWAENKEEINAIAFDGDNKKDRKLFYEMKEKIIEEAD